MIVLIFGVLGIVAAIAGFVPFVALLPVFFILLALWLMLTDRSGRKPKNARIPGLYEPKWGAYRRRIVANEKSQWQEEFDRALQASEYGRLHGRGVHASFETMSEHLGTWQRPFNALDTSKDRQVR